VSLEHEALASPQAAQRRTKRRGIVTQRIAGPKGSKRRRRFLIVPALAVLAVALFFITGAGAVHDGGVFELDNNAVNDAAAGDDWDVIFAGNGPVDSVFKTDIVNANDNTFCGGTKEIDDISAWKWCQNAASNDKNDLEDAYAAIYTGAAGTPEAGDKILYVGADRFANNGDSGLGFMFLQSGLAENACPVNGTNCTFGDGSGGTPHHTNGDIYVVSQFTGGGQAVTVDFYEWTGQGGANPHWELQDSGVDCDGSPAGDEACATVFGDGNNRTNLALFAPWPYTTKFPGLVGGVPQPAYFAEGTFFEGGVNLTENNITGCFRTILVDTSQSQKINESAQDYVFDSFQGCTSAVTTTPKDADGNDLTDHSDPANSLGDVSIGTGSVDVTDSADLEIENANTFTGTLAFFICGPIATGTCDTGGVPSGSQTVTANGPYSSDPATLTEAGRYCWRADFTSDTLGVPDASDSAETECFEVLPVTPTLDTQAVDAEGADQTEPVPFGDPVYDKATLSGTANAPGDNGGSDPGQPGNTYPSINATNGAAADGTITFTLKGPDGATTDCTTDATGTGADNPQDVTVSGDDDYFTLAFTPGSPGVYHWVASYSGDSPNTNPTDHNTECDDTGEDVTVEQIPTAISTSQFFYPNDSATVSTENDAADLPSGGQVTFSAYAGTVDATVLANCQDGGATGLLFTETVDISGASPQTVSTTNTDDAVPPGTIVYWNVQYSSGSSAVEGRESICVETSTLTITDDPGPGTAPST
jgi:hypothetical protein